MVCVLQSWIKLLYLYKIIINNVLYAEINEKFWERECSEIGWKLTLFWEAGMRLDKSASGNHQ